MSCYSRIHDMLLLFVHRTFKTGSTHEYNTSTFFLRTILLISINKYTFWVLVLILKSFYFILFGLHLQLLTHNFYTQINIYLMDLFD